MVFRSGLLLACAAVFLQIAVFLQPLLPKQYQIAPVCETITRALLKPKAQTEAMSHAMHHSHHQQHIEQAQVPTIMITMMRTISVNIVPFMPIWFYHLNLA
ncbi:hypothetical protein J832_2880 [Acinetobacter baumannii 25691_9]|nr:hypothetical protein J832_2880 [Acinetobacter baumannii 25691_9]